MAVLTVGRCGLDTVDISSVNMLREVTGTDERGMRIEGWLRGASLAQTKYLRQNLLSMSPGELIPITWSFDSDVDGWYRHRFADIHLEAEQAPYWGDGFFPFIVAADKVGRETEVWFQSRLTGTVRTNDMGLIESEVTPTISPPQGYRSFMFVGGNTAPPNAVTRPSADGDMVVFYDDSLYGTGPKWDCAPADWYEGQCSITSGTYLREGRSIANTPAGWVLSNGLIKLEPSSGAFAMSTYDDTSGWVAGATFYASYTAGTYGTWDTITVLRNRPHIVSIRLTNSWSSPVDKQHTVDLTLRRGDYFVSVKSTRSGANANMRLGLGAAATAITPADASDSCALETNSATNGHKYFVGYATDPDTESTASGYAEWESVSQVTGCFGVEYDGGGTPQTGDSTAEVVLQWMGAITEEVRPIPR